MLYSYEIKEKDYVAEMSRNDPDFKQFMNFVKEYNEQMIEMKKKNNYINNELLQKPSFKLKRKIDFNKKFFSNKRVNNNNYDLNKFKREKITINCLNKDINSNSAQKTAINKDINDNSSLDGKNLETFLPKNFNFFESPFLINNRGRVNIGLFNNYENFSLNRIKKGNRYKQINSLNFFGRINSNLSQDNSINNISNNYINRANKFLNLNNEIKITNKNNNNINNKKSSKSQIQKVKTFEKDSFIYDSLIQTSNIYIDHLLKDQNYDIKQITDKDFNIFELKKIIGQINVLPLMGRIIIETFGLKNDKIIKVNKLDSFLNAVSSQYLPTTLYHNNLHGADVCHSVCLYFLNSNAEKLFQTTVLDILSVLIASLGHDLAHPGLNNNFHINAGTELALTYNDSSCLENYHCCKLFCILKKDENNIFEILSVNDYKDIRKRMISEILATDMFYHKKIVSLAESKISQIKGDKFEFISNDKESIKQEQQCLLDFFIHLADLGHNAKLFDISLKWVELLSEEFWLQGDKEKSLGISISFLCDRENTNVPQGQINFIRGFILPTFNVLSTLFPGLNYTVENATINIGKWQELVDQKRLRGWTPKKLNKDDEKNSEKNNNNYNNKSYKIGGGFRKISADK